MGYDIHITRKKDWNDPHGPEISRAEWESACTDFPALANLAWFRDGVIKTKHLDAESWKIVCGVATSLGATVQGDDGEQYHMDGNGSLRMDKAVSSRLPISRSQIIVRIGVFILAVWSVVALALWLLGSLK